MPEVALWDFLCKVVASSRLVGLPHRNWMTNGNRLVKNKVSVIVPATDPDSAKMPDILSSLSAQTIESIYLEIILVCAATTTETVSILHDFEKAHPEQVMLVECDDLISSEEATKLGSGYASGDMVLTVDPKKDRFLPSAMEEIYLNHLCGA